MPRPGVEADPGRETPPSVRELGAYIRGQRDAARLSLRQLAARAGVSNPYLSQIERGLRKPSAEILQAIAKALGLAPETLYVRAGILGQPAPGVEVETALARDPHLTDGQRRALLETYRSFRRLGELEAAAPRRRGLFEVLSTGDLDEETIRAASPPEEPDTV